MKEIRILPAVLDDIAESAAWYDEEGYAGLGDQFTATFYSFLPKIQRDGEIYRVVHGEFRRIWLRPFPYAVFFRLYRNTWFVSFVIHSARGPRLVRDLLRERS